MTAPSQDPRAVQLPTASLTFESFLLPASDQRVLEAPHPPDTVMPLALRPTMSEGNVVTLDAVIESVRLLQEQQGKLLTKTLARHGALLFRGMPIHNALDFSRFAHAFGYSPHEIIGIVVDRTMLAPNVAPANESPKEVMIYNHNESAQVPHAPEYIFFYGHRTPARGGETPVSSSLELFARAQRDMPEFVEAIVNKGILSSIVYTFDRKRAGGSTLKQAFGKDIVEGDSKEVQRQKVEAQIARYSRGKFTTWEWTEDGIILTHRMPVVRAQPGTNLPALFTNLASLYTLVQQRDGAQMSYNASTSQTYGDGTPISGAHLAHLVKITDEIRVLHQWQKGDVLVYDNIVAQHGREPWQGAQEDRVVLASVWDGDQCPGAYGFGEWAQMVQALEG